MSRKSLLKNAKRATRELNKGQAAVSAAKKELKTQALALKATPEALALAETKRVEEHFREGLQSFANILSLGEALPVPAKAQFFTLVKGLSEVFTTNTEKLRDSLLAYIKEHGQPINENGSLEAQVPGYRLPANRTPPKYDAKKVEGLLRSKGMPVVLGLREVPSYEVEEAKLEKLISLEKGTTYFGLVTKEELEGCKTKERWAVQTPKAVTEVENNG